ncbi:hypothetical protein DFJ73DRAFT_792820 [Zopfochytrium polystomum]|nr:hypothetical protein DFJ73DRAFT_792820 [Zopfochytrium polystomum]
MAPSSPPPPSTFAVPAVPTRAFAPPPPPPSAPTTATAASQPSPPSQPAPPPSFAALTALSAAPPPPPPTQGSSAADDGSAAPKAPPLDYKVPDWSEKPDSHYALEVIKNGAVLGVVDLKKATTVLGRLPIADIPLEHASISRYHAILQCGRGNKMFLYDLGTPHKTFVNKTAIAARMFVQLKSGDMIRFGQSTRLYVLSNDADTLDDEEPPAPPAPQQARAAAQSSAGQPTPYTKPRSDNVEVTWGFAEDAVEDDAAAGDDGAAEGDEGDGEAYYYRDPRKALRVWCEARGQALAFEHVEEGKGPSKVFVATVSVELEGGSVVSASGKGGRKKEAEKEACLNACIQLDRRKVLRSSGSALRLEEMKRRREMFEELNNDDDDSFYDRTGSIDKKRRKKETTNTANKTETHESLSAKLAAKQAAIKEVEDALRAQEAAAAAKMAQATRDNDGESDALDTFMSSLESDAKRGPTTDLLQHQLAQLKKEASQLEKLVKFTAPHEVLRLPKPSPITRPTIPPPVVPAPPQPKPVAEFVPEEDDDDDQVAADDSAARRPAAGRLQPAADGPPQKTPAGTAAPPPPSASGETGKESTGATLGPEGESRRRTAAAAAATADQSETEAGDGQQQQQQQAPQPRRRRRVFGAITRGENAMHEKVEGDEQVVDAVVGGEEVSAAALAKYGY